MICRQIKLLTGHAERRVLVDFHASRLMTPTAAATSRFQIRPSDLPQTMTRGNQNEEERFGQQTPRRWGWGTPLKKRTATRITPKLKPMKNLSTSYLDPLLTAWTAPSRAIRPGGQGDHERVSTGY